jgi:DNA-directed RNA polymerase subunit RPC12/RpoP
MPIRFRCNRCNRLLGIARRKAGAETKCPHCGATIMVPHDDDGDDEQTQFDDIDELVNPVTSLPVKAAAPSIAMRSAPPPVPRAARPGHEAIPLPPEERPLFERDVETVLGAINYAPNGTEPVKKKSAPTAGLDAMSLAHERSHIVLSAQLATALAVVVVVLMALSFGAGFLVASW